MRLSPVTPAPHFEAIGMTGNTISSDSFIGRPLWLVLSRYAACPFCSLRLDALTRRYDEIESSGVQLVVLFPSPVERIEQYVMRFNPPFCVAADPQGLVFAKFGSETSWLGELRSAVDLVKVARALVHAPNNPLAIDGPVHRMPSEFLIDPAGQITEVHYGTTLDDGFPIDDVLAWARTVPPGANAV